MALRLKTAPAFDPVSVAEAKAHCRLDRDDEDSLIALYIKAAVAHVEGNGGISGRAVANQTWELYCDTFPEGAIAIPLGPLVSVSSVEYLDPDTLTWAQMDGSAYSVDAVSWEGSVSPVDAWPTAADTPNAVRVTFVAGHGNAAESIPAHIKLMVLCLVGHWYENRETVVIGAPAASVPLMFDALVDAFRKITV